MKKTKIDYTFWAVWLIIILIYIGIRQDIIDTPLNRDEGIFSYMEQLILNPGLPYRDVFEHKPPVAYYINALALLFVPPTPSGIHIFLHFYNFLTLISLYLLTKVYFNSTSAGLWTAFRYAYSLPVRPHSSLGYRPCAQSN